MSIAGNLVRCRVGQLWLHRPEQRPHPCYLHRHLWLWWQLQPGSSLYLRHYSMHLADVSAAFQWVHITNLANGKSAWGQTRDSCPSCGSGDLGAYLFREQHAQTPLLICDFVYADMSPSLFQQLGSLDTGVLSISWHFENKNFSP